MIKYIFFGGKDIGNYILYNLIKSDFIPNGIVAYKDIINEDLLELAISKGAKIYRIEKFKSEQDNILNFIKQFDLKVYISVAFPYILPQSLLDQVDLPINIHTGALPKYRGHHPISAALLNDEPFQGTTVHIMKSDVDSGDVLQQDLIKIENEDDINTIKQKLIVKSYELLKIVISQIENDCLFFKKQHGEVVWAPKRTIEDSKIDLNNKSRFLHNFIRALVDPYPNAFIQSEKGKINFKKSIISNKPGIILDKTINNRYVVSTTDGVILVEIDADLEIGQLLY